MGETYFGGFFYHVFYLWQNNRLNFLLFICLDFFHVLGVCIFSSLYKSFCEVKMNMEDNSSV